MLHSVTFLKDYARGRSENLIFKKDEVFVFEKGLNLIVGDQGTGKSTLLWLLRSVAHGRGTKTFSPCPNPLEIIRLHSDKCKVSSMDFELDTPRNAAGSIDSMSEIVSRWMSHGEVTRQLIQDMPKEDDGLLLLDEPDNALCVRSIHKLYATLKDRYQVIAVAHNPLLISLVGHVFDMEDRKWKSADEFLKSQKPSEDPS